MHPPRPGLRPVCRWRPPPMPGRRPGDRRKCQDMSWDVMFCHGTGLRPGRSQGIAASLSVPGPGRPLPEERASSAHNARAHFAAARGRPHARRREGPLRECHGMSCFVMGPVSAPVVCAGPGVVRTALQRPFRPWSRTPRCRRSVPLSRIMRARVSRRRACARARRRALQPTSPPVRGEGRSRSFVPPWGPGAGRGVPVSRVSCAGACAGGRAYRGGAVCARDCPCARARGSRPGKGRTPPVRSRRGVCGAPTVLSAESGMAAPEAAFPSCLFYPIPLEIKSIQEQKMIISGNFLTTG